MSPPKHSQPSSAHWAAVLQQARVELELLSGETFTLPGASKQAASSLTMSSSTAADEISWSVVVKKKGKKGKKGKREGKKKVGKQPASAKSPSHSICGSFKESVTWHTRDVMKARTEWKHKKKRVYTYTSLPKDFQIYQDTKALSKAEKHRIVSGHRFHPQHGLEPIPEDGELFLLKPRLPRVDPIPHQRQGPAAVVPAPIPTKSLWSQVAAKPAVPKVPKVPVSPSFTKVSVKPPVTKPVVPEVPVEAPVKPKKRSQTLGRPASKVSPGAVSAATSKLPEPRVDSTLRRQGPVPIDFKDDNSKADTSTPVSTKTPWSQVVAKPAVPEVPVKPRVKPTLRRQGPVVPIVFNDNKEDEANSPSPASNKSLWSQVAAKPTVSKAPVKPEGPVKPRVKPTLRRQGPVVPIVFNDNKEDEANSPSPASNKSLWSQVAAKPAVPQAPIKPAVKPPVSRTMKRSQTLGLPVSRDVELSPAPVAPKPEHRPRTITTKKQPGNCGARELEGAKEPDVGGR